MRCLVVSCVFSPEPVVSARTSTELAAKLVELGHDVTVIAPFPSRPGGKLHADYKRALYRRERSEAGYHLIRCWSTLSQESSMASRFLENLSFGITGGLAALFAGRPDVVYSNTWPVFATVLIAIVARLRSIPLVISVQDVYPESLIAQGRISDSGILARLLRSIDTFAIRRAAAIVVISRTFAAIYEHTRAIPPHKISIIPNWLSSSIVMPDREGARRIREQLAIPAHACLAVYGGNVGVAAGVEMLVEAMHYLGPDSGIYLLIAGDGSQMPICRAMAGRLLDRTVFLHSPWLASETSAVLGAADILVLPTRGEQSLASVPSKLITYMLADRPIVAQAVHSSELTETIRKADCGWVVEPGSVEVLAQAVQQAATLPAAELERRAHSGYRYALAHLTTEANLPLLVHILETSGSR